MRTRIGAALMIVVAAFLMSGGHLIPLIIG